MSDPITRDQIGLALAANRAMHEQYTAELAAISSRQEWLRGMLRTLDRVHAATLCLLAYTPLEAGPIIAADDDDIPF